MPEGWEWDETLFGGCAKYYARGRLPYPQNLADALASTLGLDGTGRLLDVGCGPGTVGLQVAHLFDEVVGVDADREMVEEARRASASRGDATSRWLQMRAEDLSADVGAFRVATFAQSFHWMDRERVAAIVFDLLQPNGAFVHVDCASTVVPPLPVQTGRRGEHPEPPFESIDALVRRYLGPGRRAGQGVLRHGTPSGESKIVEDAGFGAPQTVFVGGGAWSSRSIDDLVAYVFASSASAPHLFAKQIDTFEHELRALLTEASPSGLFSQRAPYTQLRLWRKRPLR